MHVFMCFLHLVPTFPPHDIIAEKGPFYDWMINGIVMLLFQSEPKPTLSHENLLINELIRDYLEFNSYNYTSSVLLAGTCSELQHSYDNFSTLSLAVCFSYCKQQSECASLVPRSVHHSKD